MRSNFWFVVGVTLLVLNAADFVRAAVEFAPGVDVLGYLVSAVGVGLSLWIVVTACGRKS